LRLIAWLIGLPLAVMAAVFAVANRHDVRLELWPFPWSMDLPVYLAVLVPLLLGLVLGAVLVGLSNLKTRARVSTERRRAESLQRQLDAARKEAATQPVPAAPSEHA
jgi:uncharacterized integral membrane protein